MSTDRELPRILRSWLHEDRHEVAEPIVDTVLAKISSTPQRRTRRTAGRDSLVNTYLKYALAAAAVVVIAVVVINLLPGSPAPGGEPSPSPQPTPSATASAEPSAPTDGSLAVGSSHVLWARLGAYGIDINVTIPGAGWFGAPGEGVLKKNNNADAPDGAGLIVFARTNDILVGLGDVYVYGDPCHWATTKPSTPVETVDEAIAALSAQPSRDATSPVDVTYDGYAGKYITLHVPDDAVFSDCDEGEFRTLVEGQDTPRSHEDPGQFDLFTVLDVNGELVIFDVAYYEGAEGTPGSVLDEMAAIMTSATLEYVD